MYTNCNIVNTLDRKENNGQEMLYEFQDVQRKARVDKWRMRKYRAVMRKTLMNIKTTKHEIFVIDKSCSDVDSNNDDENKKTRTPNEKYSQGNELELSNKNIDRKITTLQNQRINHFPRRYLKTKRKSGSLTDLQLLSKENRTQRIKTHLLPVECKAIAVRDSFPSPYDKQALTFRMGDLIEVTSRNQNGLWRGRCNGREGYFKFIDVSTIEGDCGINKTSSKKENESRSVLDLLAALNLESLTPIFVLNGYDTMEDIQSMSEYDMKYLGIEDADVRGTLMKAAKFNSSPFKT